MTDQHTWQSITDDWPTNTPAYQSGLTDQPAYPCQHTSLSLQADWPPNIPDIIISIRETYQPIHQGWLTNIPDYLSGMTDQPTYLTIRVDWLTNTPTFLSGLTDSQTYPTMYPYWNLCIVSCLPVHAYYPPSYKDRLTSAFLFSLLTIISAYLSGLTDYLSRPTDWPTSCYLRIYIWTDCLSVWLTIMPVFLSCVPVWVNYRPTYMPTYLSWLRNISAFLSCLTYQGWLNDQRTCLPAWAGSYQTYRLGLTDQQIYLSTYQGWLG